MRKYFSHFYTILSQLTIRKVKLDLIKNPTFNDIKNLLTYIEDYPQTETGILIHAGGSIKWLHEKRGQKGGRWF